MGLLRGEGSGRRAIMPSIAVVVQYPVGSREGAPPARGLTQARGPGIKGPGPVSAALFRR
jgi:hypothetical protein